MRVDDGVTGWLICENGSDGHQNRGVIETGSKIGKYLVGDFDWEVGTDSVQDILKTGKLVRPASSPSSSPDIRHDLGKYFQEPFIYPCTLAKRRLGDLTNDLNGCSRCGLVGQTGGDEG